MSLQVWSRLTQARGLKPDEVRAAHASRQVAPHAGARIETYRGLRYERRRAVAPHAGARIETHARRYMPLKASVAPHAGARIETSLLAAPACPSRSGLTQARGLNPPRRGSWAEPALVAPHAGARIETVPSRTGRREQ